jgi:hypothetical protein
MMIPTEVGAEKGHYIVEAFSDEKRYQRYQSFCVGMKDVGVFPFATQQRQ